jgi:hypothetical protein
MSRRILRGITWNHSRALPPLVATAHLFPNLMGMCISRGSAVAIDPDEMFDREIALRCLEDLRELAQYLNEQYRLSLAASEDA